MGAFLLGRPALYCREQDEWILFLSFRGNDPHEGISPSTHSASKFSENEQKFLMELDKHLKGAGCVNRIAYVVYQSARVAHRRIPVLATTDTKFGSQGISPSSMGQSHKFIEQLHILGSPTDSATRMAREAIYSFANQLAVSGLSLHGLSFAHMAGAIQFWDEGEKLFKQIGPQALPFDLSKSEDCIWMAQMRGHYMWYQQSYLKIHLNLLRSEWGQQRGSNIAQGNTEQLFPLSHFGSILGASTHHDCSDSDELELAVEEIIDVKFENNKVHTRIPICMETITHHEMLIGYLPSEIPEW